MILALLVNLSLGWWLLPTTFTLFCLWKIRESAQDTTGRGQYFDFSFLSVLFGLLWLIPALFSWVLYFAILYFTK